MNDLTLRRMNRFLDKFPFPDGALEKYYGIITPIIRVDTDSIQENEILLSICFQKKNPIIYNFLKLPDDMNTLIADYYNLDYMDIHAKIIFTSSYPFRPPIWEYVDMRTNLCSQKLSLDLVEYYQYLIHNHNQQYEHYWTPVTDIEQDILDFVRKINHFEFLLEPWNI
jgi:hypothetical protein